MATYYVSPSGDGSDGTSWAKAHKTIQSALNAHAASGVVIEIDGGAISQRYSEAISIPGGFVGQIIGSAQLGRDGEVIIDSAGLALDTFTATNGGAVTVSDISIGNCDTAKQNVNVGAGPVTFFRCKLLCGYKELYSTKSVTYNSCEFIGRGTVEDTAMSFLLSSSSGGVVKFINCRLRNISGAIVCRNGSIEITNTIIRGTRNGDVVRAENNNSQSIIISNSYVCGSKGSYTLNNNTTNATISARNSVIKPNPLNPSYFNNGTITDSGGNIGLTADADQLMRALSPRRRFFLVFGVDDAENVSTWEVVAGKLEAKGWRGTWAINTDSVGKSTNATWDDVRAAVTAGHEVSAHTQRHVNLTNLQSFSLLHATATASISGGVLQLSTGQSITPGSYANIAALVAHLNTLSGYTATVNAAAYSGSASPSCLADISTTPLSPAHAFLHDQAKLFAEEINGSKSVIESNVVGYDCDTLICPGDYTSATVRAAIKAAGFLGARGNSSGTTDLVSGINIYYVKDFLLDTAFGTYFLRQLTSILDYMNFVGGVLCMYSHDFGTFTQENWDTLLSIVEDSGATVTTLSDAVTRLSGAIDDPLIPSGTTADGMSYSWVASDFVDAANDRLRPDSPCIGVGLNVGLTTDLDGNAVPGAVGYDIGPYSYMPGWTPFDGSMPPLSLAATCPGSLLEVQEWTRSDVTKGEMP